MLVIEVSYIISETFSLYTTEVTVKTKGHLQVQVTNYDLQGSSFN